MPPKRKKSVRQKQKQRQSQSQRITINVGKTTPAKKRNSGRGRLPPPSYQQNLFPPTIIQQQAPNIAVLENQISRLTAKIEEPIGIKQPTTPLGLETQTKAKTAEAQRLAGEQAEARRPGPTAENFQVPPSIADYIKEQEEEKKKEPISLSRQAVGEFGVDAFGFPEPPSGQSNLQSRIRKMRESLEEPIVRPPDPVFSNRLVNPADPPKMGEGGGGLPFAESVIKRGARIKDPTKITTGIPISTPSAKPVKPPKKEKTMLDFTKRTEQAGAVL